MPQVDIVNGEVFTKEWTFTETVIVEDEEGVSEETSPIDLTGYEAYVQIRKYPWSEEVIASYEGAGYLINGGEDGTISLTVPFEEVNQLEMINGYIDCLVYLDTTGYRSEREPVVYHTGVTRPIAQEA